MKYLRDNLIYLRLLHGWSQTELATKLSVSRQHVNNWERGNKGSIPSLNLLNRMAEIYIVTIDDLLNKDIRTEFLNFLKTKLASAGNGA
jgi:transcriptional regulator with XRE-family HTH domain